MNLPDLLAENARHRAALEPPYDPLTGVGCYGDRFALPVAEGAVVYLPVSMLADAEVGPDVQAILAAGGLHRVPLDDAERAAVEDAVIARRILHDPEFWFAAACRIKTKSGGLVPFVLNPPQRLLLAALLAPYLAGEPVRIILVKARQWGGSTLTQLFMAWVQQTQRTGWNAAIVADVQAQAAHIRGMYRTVAKHYPRSLGRFTLAPYEGQATVKYIPERDCIVGVASTKNPDGVRSFTYQMLHLSEVGLWGSTPHQSGEDLAQSLEGGLVGGAGTICVKESTAKGVGNYFHREWQSAVKGESAYRPMFVAWHQIAEYQTPLTAAAAADLVASFTSYERFLWEIGATLEGIAWYREKLRSMPAGEREWRMMAEFPSTTDEAFQSTGRRVFAPEYVRRARRSCRDPLYRAHIYANARKGKAALENVRLIQDRYNGLYHGGYNINSGDVSVWVEPNAPVRGVDPATHRISRRYAAFLDIGARHSEGDWHVLTILDRAGMLHGDGPEVAAEWRCHRDQDLAAWEAAQICRLYDTALLAVEVNSLHTEGDEAGHHLTVLDELGDAYPNLYARVGPADADAVVAGAPRRWGFATNRASKALIVDALNAALREDGYTERCAGACDEMDYYEIDERGRMNAREGQHDDRVISRAGAVWLATSFMEPPVIVEIGRRMTTSRPGAAAVIG